MPGHLFHRSTKQRLPVVRSGSGLELIAADGSRYLDACGGAAVSCLGHGHPAVTRAIVEQAGKIAFAHTSFFTNEPAEALADAIANACPGSLQRVYFVGGGSEAIETSLKMARQYHIERGDPERTRIISRQQSYHGNTLGALAAGGNANRRAPYEPLLIPVSHIDPCFEYRYARSGETSVEYAERAGAALEIEIQRIGPEKVMAFVAETVVGATIGAVPPAPGYLAAIRRICDRYGVLLILDEVMCGAGRTGTYLACEQDGVVPDIVTLAKGLGGGYQPIGAAVCTEKIYSAFEQGSGAFQHGHTYSAHAIACAAALAVQRVIEEDGLLEQVRQRGEQLRAALLRQLGGHVHVGDIRGRGLLQAVEFVRDRATRAPFDPEMRLSTRIRQCAFEAGLMVYPGSGTVDGRSGDHILLAPPYTVTSGELDEIVRRLAMAVDRALGG